MLISKTNKMKNIKYIILALSGFFLVTSCDRDLDINPAQSITTDQAISTPENINNILVQINKVTIIFASCIDFFEFIVIRNQRSGICDTRQGLIYKRLWIQLFLNKLVIGIIIWVSDIEFPLLVTR